MTDSSSDEEDRFKILQAVDKEFTNDSLYKVGLEKVKPNSLTSLRPRYPEACDADQHNLNGLNVTPEFQRHVAKHLSNLLDGQLKEISEDMYQTRKQVKRKLSKEGSGVRLFYSSSKNLSSQDPADISKVHNAKYKFKGHNDDSEEELVKISESVVSSAWVLTGEAVRGWVKSTRGEVVPGVFKQTGTISQTVKKIKK